jgi:nucleoside-diphosphate-sugar epimerase
VHLAAALGADVKQLLTTNVNGTYQVFEAARAAGVRRVVYASSGATVGGYEADEPFRAMVEARWADVPAPAPLVTHADPVRPSGVYGVTKVFGEALARYYADAFGMSMLCLRIGAVLPADRPEDSRQAAVFLSQRDAVQAIVRCLDAPPEVRFAVMFAVSDNRGRYRDVEHTRRTIGFEPQDASPDREP